MFQEKFLNFLIVLLLTPYSWIRVEIRRIINPEFLFHTVPGVYIRKIKSFYLLGDFLKNKSMLLYDTYITNNF